MSQQSLFEIKNYEIYATERNCGFKYAWILLTVV
jgi:hypothetical protein